MTEPVSAAEVARVRFERALRGYSPQEVDSFLVEVEGGLARLESGDEPELKAEDVRAVRFRLSILGYAERQVDLFLEEVAETLTG